ncbi:MAG TPA: MFS transporter [Candidatus Dormibacteraeota bacterium]|jgi:MFS family permease|nr:MFS transporter [Candidatus Dormibacteraeota bacterium]
MVASQTFRSLRVRNYRLFLSGTVVSNIGTWVQRVAQDWLVLQLTHHNGAALGITTGLQFLPVLLGGLWGGVITDRYNKRRLLMCTQVLFGLVALLLGVLTVTGLVQVWYVYILAFATGAVTIFDNPSRQIFVVEMVGPDDVSNAVGLNSASFNLARIAGPAVAGFLIAIIGTGPLFFFNAASYLAVIASLIAMRESELQVQPRIARARGQLVAGLRYVVAKPELLLPLIMVAFIGTFGLNFQILTALFATNVFHRGASSYGLLTSAVAAGSLIGALYSARRSRPTTLVLVGAGIVFGVLEIVCGLMPTYLAFAVLLVPTGLAALVISTSANSTVQLHSDPSVRGRVMALYLLVFMGGTPIGAPFIGWLADQFGPRSGLLFGGAISILATVFAILLVLHLQNRGVRSWFRQQRYGLSPVDEEEDDTEEDEGRRLETA